MGKKLIRIMMVLCMLLSFTFLAGCSAGSTIDTTLNINKDMSGTRVMTIKINNSVFGEYFKGSADDLKAVVDSSCPSAMTYEYSEADGNPTYTFTISFTSKDDYLNKVGSLVEGATVDIQVPDTVWANGFAVNESFTSKDLMAWLSKAVTDAGLVDSSNLNMVFGDGSTNVVYDSKPYDTGTTVSVNNVNYISLDNIGIYTDVTRNKDGSYEFERRAEFTVSDDALGDQKDAVDGYMQKMAGGEIKCKADDTEGNTTYVISQSKADIKGLNAFDKKVFGGSSACKASDAGAASSPFVISSAYGEKIDTGNYLVKDQTYTTMTYNVKADGLKLYSVNDSGAMTEAYSAADQEYKQLFAQSGFSGVADISAVIEKPYQVSKLDVTTQRNQFTDRWVRTSSFVLGEVPTDPDSALISNSFNERMHIDDAEASSAETSSAVKTTSASTAAQTDMDETKETAQSQTAAETGETVAEVEPAECTVSTETKDNVYTLKITMEGDQAQINKSMMLLTGTGSSLAYITDGGFYKIKQNETIGDQADYSALIGGDDANSDKTTVCTYTLKTGSGMEKVYSDNNNVGLYDGQLSLSSGDGSFSYAYTGRSLNFIAVIFWVLMAAGVVLILVALNKSGVIEKKTGGAKPGNGAWVAGGSQQTSVRAAQPETPIQPQVQVQPETPAQAGVDEGTQFCEECGTKRAPGALFCEKCGHRF